MKITVFGGSSPKPGQTAYQEAYLLGKMLGTSGNTILTGGYIGTMEAVSKGAREAGGHVIGVTCDEIETWRPVKPNTWIMEERRYPTLHERLVELIQGCDVAIALPGGIGTLAEIAQMWSFLQVGTIPPRPLILVGEGWKDVIQVLFRAFPTYIFPKHRQLVTLTKDVRQAAALAIKS